MTPTTAEVTEFQAVANELGVSSDDRMRVMRGLGWLAPTRAASSGLSACTCGTTRAAAAHDMTAPPPPDFNAAIIAARAEGGDGYRTPTPKGTPLVDPTKTVKSLTAPTPFAAMKPMPRTPAPPPPDFNAAIRAMLAARDASRAPAATRPTSTLSVKQQVTSIRASAHDDRHAPPSPTFADHNAAIRQAHAQRARR